jgi:hypothetical protein
MLLSTLRALRRRGAAEASASSAIRFALGQRRCQTEWRSQIVTRVVRSEQTRSPLGERRHNLRRLLPAQQFAALVFAATTGLRTHLAMFVVGCVTVTFRTACGAAERTHFELSAHDSRISVEQPRKNSRGHVADVGAILVEANAPPQIGGLLLAEASVGTGHTRLSALEASSDTARKRGRRTGATRAGGDHPFDGLHGIPPMGCRISAGRHGASRNRAPTVAGSVTARSRRRCQ